MENLSFRYSETYQTEFQSLREFVEYIDLRLRETEILKLRFKFVADVVKTKPYNGSLYITVSQETADGKKTELTVIVWKNLASAILTTLGIKKLEELEHKKWIFQGKLSFYPERAQFSFWADSIAPQGESDILQRRQKIKELLKKEKLLMEEIHELSELEPIKRIAVITSKTAQGYFDFLSNLLVPDSIKPIVHLYESSMQGAATVQEVIKALDRIEQFCNENENNIKYDVVVLIRGGGGPSDLMYFDDYELAKRIAKMNNFIPVLTGIGHEKDETIPDFVAWKRFPTPTAVAKEISNQLKNYLDSVERSQKEFNQIMESKIDVINARLGKDTYKTLADTFERIVKSQKDKIKDLGNVLYNSFSLKKYEKSLSHEFLSLISSKVNSKISDLQKIIESSKETLSKTTDMKLQAKTQVIEKHQNISEIVEKRYVNALNLLEKMREDLIKTGGPLSSLTFGGALITKSGQLISRKAQLSEGEIIDVHFLDGKISAKIEKSKNSFRNSSRK